MLYCLCFLYVLTGLVGLFKIRSFFGNRAATAVRCSCKTAATVKDICKFGRCGRRYVLDYYDLKDQHYVVSFFSKYYPRRWAVNAIVPVYFNPHDPMEISVPDDTGMMQDMGALSLFAGICYVLLGVIAFFAWRFLV